MQLLYLLARNLELLDAPGDRLERHRAAFLALGHQRAQLLDLQHGGVVGRH